MDSSCKNSRSVVLISFGSYQKTRHERRVGKRKASTSSLLFFRRAKEKRKRGTQFCSMSLSCLFIAFSIAFILIDFEAFNTFFICASQKTRYERRECSRGRQTQNFIFSFSFPSRARETRKSQNLRIFFASSSRLSLVPASNNFDQRFFVLFRISLATRDKKRKKKKKKKIQQQ